VRELVERSLAELGVPTTTPVVATEVPEPSVKLELDKFAGKVVVAIVYPDGQRALKFIDSMKRDCELNIFNPKLCQAFEAVLPTVQQSAKEGGGGVGG
jgi:hypothetical protein